VFIPDDTRITTAVPLASDLHLRRSAHRSTRSGWQPEGQGFQSPWVHSQRKTLLARQSIDEKPARSSYNPEALPERTLRGVKLFELGPVTFPAYAGATAQLA
jgi:hypothetical protein